MRYHSTLSGGRASRLAVETLEHRTLLTADGFSPGLPQILEADNSAVQHTAETTVYDTFETSRAGLPGDANHDRVFDELDINQVLQAGKYLTGDSADWSEGDWNGDGLFNQKDLVAALQVATAETAFAHWGAKRGTDRPLKGSLSGMVTFEYDDPQFPVTTVMNAVGTMSHLGKVESHWTHNPPVGMPNYINGQVVLTAANGDELRGEYGDVPHLLPEFTVDVVGGSGRFENATGTIEVSAEVQGEWGPDGLPIQPWYTWMELSGEISY